MLTVNIKDDMPPVDVAMRRLEGAIYREKLRTTGVIKIVHGYGSTGKGGAIKDASIKALQGYKSRGVIKDYILGESFGNYNVKARDLTRRYPLLKKDSDYGRYNDGITIIILR